MTLERDRTRRVAGVCTIGAEDRAKRHIRREQPAPSVCERRHGAECVGRLPLSGLRQPAGPWRESEGQQT